MQIAELELRIMVAVPDEFHDTESIRAWLLEMLARQKARKFDPDTFIRLVAIHSMTGASACEYDLYKEDFTFPD